MNWKCKNNTRFFPNIKSQYLWLLLLPVICCSDSPDGQGISFRVNKISERVTMFTPGTYATTVPSTVITTTDGLILIDTGLSPSIAQKTRHRISKELGRNDFTTVINTHAHFDHSSGNQIYSQAQIFGHNNAPAAIQRFANGIDGFISRRRERISRLKNELKGFAPNSTEARSHQESIQLDSIFIKDLQNAYIPTPPDRTFSDRLSLNIEDITIRMFAFGRAHTDSDIIVHVPELGLLLVGDLFHSNYLSVTTGPPPLDVPRWLEVLDIVFENPDQIQTIIGGHGELIDSGWLLAQRRYVRDVWTAIVQAQKEGRKLEDVIGNQALQPSYGYLKEYFDLESEGNTTRHRENIRSYWRSNLKSAAADIEQVIRSEGIDAAVIRLADLRLNFEHQFFVDEREFNQLGYRLLQSRNVNEALTVFKMNAATFPESWNAWDSLGEAYMWSGDDENSERCYLKSVELNPENKNGLRTLSRFRGYRLDAERETRESSRFSPGTSTGLKGPYLGQEPPGTEPEVFAPGIVSIHESMDFSITFSPDGREIHFTQRADNGGRNTIYFCRLEANGWTAPAEAPFTGGFSSNEPFITPDGDKLYYGSNRPVPGKEGPEYRIWVSEKDGEIWGPASYHGPGMFVSTDSQGHMYLTDISNAAGGGFLRYPFRNGAYGQPERLPAQINSPTPVAHGYIAPDGSFLLFDASNRPDSQGGEGDFFVSFKKSDGSWAEAINLGEPVNSPATHLCPSLSPDGKYLFYSTCKDIYWVSTEVIKRLKSD